MALALGWHRAQYRPRLLDLSERLEVRAKLDRYLEPGAVRSVTGEMTRQYLGNAMMRLGAGDDPDEFDADERAGWE